MANDGLITSTVAKQAYDELQKLDDSLEKVYQNILKINGIKSNVPSVLGGASGQSTASMQKLVAIREKSNASIERERLSEIRLQQQREKAFDKAEKSLAKEEALLRRSETAYNRIQSSVRVLTQTYQDLAIRKQLGNTLTVKEEAQLLSITNRLNMYQSALKKVDADIQKNQRNVGNYTSGWNGLGNSINQITRELPAFTFSAQTGFLALSNNIPILTDEIGKLQKANKELVAQGKPVTSVFSQILGSFLSLQTLMGVGILLFTLYGDKIADFTSKLFSGSKGIDVMAESQSQLNKIRIDSQKSIIDETIALQANLKTAADTTLSLKEREIAANNVLKQYPFWFENLGKEAILNGNVADAVREVNAALLARAKANAAVSKITENQSKIIDLEERRLTVAERLNAARKALIEISKNVTSGAGQGAAGLTMEQAEATKELAQINQEISDLTAINNRLTGYAIENTKQAIGLDYQEAASKELKTEKLVDYNATLFELQKKQLEGQANYYKQVMDAEDNAASDREFGAIKLNETLNKISELQLNETLRLIRKETEDRRAELLKQAKDGEISTANANAVISSLEQDELIKRQLAYETFSQEVTANNNQVAESFKNVFSTISAQEQKNIFSQKSIDNLRQVGLLLEGAKGKSTVKEFEAIEKAIKKVGEAQDDLEIEQLRNQRESIGAEIERISKLEKNKENNAAINLLKSQQLEIDNKLVSAENLKLEKIKQQKQEAASLRESYLKTFTDLGQFGLGALNQFFDGSFKKLLEGTKLIEDAGERARAQFQLTFTAVTEVMQQVVAFAQQNQQAQYDAMYAQLDQQKRIADGFAKSEAAKAEVEKQYEERRREIRRKELQAQKEQAIFNAVINTAQGVTAALPNFVLAGLVAALGAAQIALISAREIPAYAEGTDYHKGGLARVGDGGRHELIWQPSKGYSVSPDTDTLVNLEKGSKVFPDLKEVGMTLLSSGMPSINNMGGQMLTESQMTRAVKNAIGNKPVVNVELTKSGLKSYVNTQGSRQKQLNDKLSFKGSVL